MKRFGFLLAALALFVYFFGLGSYGLINPDEGRYAEIPREMLESGDFVTPRLNYVKYFEKPVLHYWLTAGSFALFGQNEFAARMTPVLCGLGGAFVTFLMARRMYGLRAGVYAATILSTGLLWFAVSRLNIIDMTVSFFVTLSLAGFWWGTANASEQGRRWFLLFYTGMALATLSKGLIGIVLPGGTVFWYIVFTRKWRLIPRMLYWPGIALFFLLSAPWYWKVCAANDDFFHFFFIQEHFLRYMTRMHERYEPFWYFAPVLIGGLMPWAGLLPDTIRSIFFGGLPDDGKRNLHAAGLFLGLWFAVPFLFFSLSDSKLVPYIVPCLPPLAIAGGRLLVSIADGDEKRAVRFALLNGVMLTLAAIVGVVYPFLDKKLGPAVLLPYTLPAAAVLALSAVCGWWFCRKGAWRRMTDCLCVLAFVNVLVLSQGFALKAELDSSKNVAATISERIRPKDVVVGYKNLFQGLGFYLERRIVLAEVTNELKFGADQEKDPRWFIDDEALKELWQGQERVFLVTDARRTEKLERLLDGKVRELSRTRSTAVLANF